MAGSLENYPICFGLGASLITFVVVSLMTPPVRPEVRAEWDARLRASDTEDVRTLPVETTRT